MTGKGKGKDRSLPNSPKPSPRGPEQKQKKQHVENQPSTSGSQPKTPNKSQKGLTTTQPQIRILQRKGATQGPAMLGGDDSFPPLGDTPTTSRDYGAPPSHLEKGRYIPQSTDFHLEAQSANITLPQAVMKHSPQKKEMNIMDRAVMQINARQASMQLPQAYGTIPTFTNEQLLCARWQGFLPRNDREDDRVYTVDNIPTKGNGILYFTDYEQNLFEVSISTFTQGDATIISAKQLNTRHDKCLSAILDRTADPTKIRPVLTNLLTEVIEWDIEACAGSQQIKGRNTNVRPILNAVQPVNEDSLPYLAKHSITRMKKKHEAFPDYIYYCELCDHHCSSIIAVKAHLEKGHLVEEKRLTDLARIIDAIPAPVPAQLEYISTKFDHILAKRPNDPESGVSRLRIQAEKIRDRLKDSLIRGREEFENVDIKLFGSVLTDCDDVFSDINLALIIPEEHSSDAPDLMESVLSHVEMILGVGLTASPEELSCKLKQHPLSVVAEHVEGTRIIIRWTASEELMTSQLISLYTKIRPDTAKLIRLVRRWAKIGEIDDSNIMKPGLTKYGFDLMVIHFLQKIDLLPVLHEQEWFEEPIDEDPLQRKDHYCKDIEKILNGIGSNEESWNLAELFIGFLRHYVKEHSELVQIVSKAPLSKDVTKWSKKFFQIMDPFRSTNVVQYARSVQVFFYNVFLKSYTYFAIPQTKEGPLVEIRLYQKKDESPLKKKWKANVDTVQPVPTTPTCDARRKLNNLEPMSKVASTDMSPGMSKTEAAIKDLPEPLPVERTSTESSSKPSEVATEEETMEDQAKEDVIEDDNLSNEADKEEEVKEYHEELEEEEEGDVEKIERLMGELTIDDKRLKELSKEDVEIDDDSVYSRKSMHEIRDTNSRLLDEEVFEKIFREGISYGEEEEVFEGTERPLTYQKTPKFVRFPKKVHEPTSNRKSERNRRRKDKIRKSTSDEKSESESSKQESVVDSVEVKSSTQIAHVNCVVESKSISNVKTKHSTKQKSTTTTPVKISNDAKPSTPVKTIPPPNAKPSTPMKTIPPPNEFQISTKSVTPDEKTSTEEVTEAAIEVTTTTKTTTEVTKTMRVKKPGRENICFEEFFAEVDETFNAEALKTMTASVDVSSLHYTMATENFTNGFKADFKCTCCEKTDHSADFCPQLQIPKPLVLSDARTPESIYEINTIIMEYYDALRLKDKTLYDVNLLVKRLTQQIKEKYKAARLDIFGSMHNGIGANDSDLDLCLRFDSDTLPSEYDPRDVIQRVAEVLYKYRYEYYDIQAITNAKVPIVKFKCNGLDIDISYYNVLALYNTQMIRAYCDLAPNILPPLGMWVKRWAKACDIGDASKGSLSSYAYTLLLIHFLQQRNFLPILQESDNIVNEEKIMVDGWDVTFCRDYPPEMEHQSFEILCDLFCDFLDYYSRFDFDNKVVQIRQKKPLSKIAKDWKKSINIEDPFDRNHNLGSGVTRKMFVFIMRNFNNSYEILLKNKARIEFAKNQLRLDGAMQGFSIPPSVYTDYFNHLMASFSLGSAPSDRCCHYCHHVGHFTDTCPKKQRDMQNGHRGMRPPGIRGGRLFRPTQPGASRGRGASLMQGTR